LSLKGKGQKNRRAIFQNDRARESNGNQIINGMGKPMGKERPDQFVVKKGLTAKF